MPVLPAVNAVPIGGAGCAVLSQQRGGEPWMASAAMRGVQMGVRGTGRSLPSDFLLGSLGLESSR